MDENIEKLKEIFYSLPYKEISLKNYKKLEEEWIKLHNKINDLEQEVDKLKKERDELIKSNTFWIKENEKESKLRVKYYLEGESLKAQLEEEILDKEIAQGHRKQVQDIELAERKELEKYKAKHKQVLELLTHFDSGQICEQTKSLAIEIEKMLDIKQEK